MVNFYDIIIQLIPVQAICFVLILVSYKAYYKIRARFNVLVNCWFCNQNTKVPYVTKNSWDCPYCEQYNGFNKEGDYNREIIEQLDCSDDKINTTYAQPELKDFRSVNYNGFCENCNDNQRIKVEKLSQFEPKKESNFDNEIKLYRMKLEEEYRLCPTCDRHLGKVLRDKKKMVLGSKFLDFIVKGAENLAKNPKLNINQTQRTTFKTIISILLLLLAITNFFLIIKDLTSVIRKGLGKDFSDPVARFILILISYFLAIVNLFKTYFEQILQYEGILKLYLFIRTMCYLCLNSVGISMPVNIFTESTLSVTGIPFTSIFLAFIHNILDGFQITRYTMLLTIWSIYAGTINSDFGDAQILKLITSLAAIIFSLPKLKLFAETRINDSETSSFHKIYSDYLTDNDDSFTNGLNSSMGSTKSYGSSFRTRNSTSPRLNIRTSSTISLNKKSQTSSFQRHINNNQQQSYNNHFSPIQQYPSYNPMFASNMELNRSQSIFNLHNQSVCCGDANKTFSAIGDHEHPLNERNNLLTTVPQPFRSTTTFENDRKFQGNHFVNPVMSAQTLGTIHSPFSYSNSSVCGDRANLLTPSRFSSSRNGLFGSQSSWLSGGYFNNIQQKVFIPNPTICCTNPLTPQTRTIFNNHENLSRASSQSSGFESQGSSNQNTLTNNKNHNFSNNIISNTDTSCCNDFDYSPDDHNLFQPQSSICMNSYRTDPFNLQNQLRTSPSQHNLSGSSYNYSNLTTPVSIICASPGGGGSTGVLDWRQKSNRDLSQTNSFNLNKINEELPAIQKGSLLKKWKEQQTEKSLT